MNKCENRGVAVAGRIRKKPTARLDVSVDQLSGRIAVEEVAPEQRCLARRVRSYVRTWHT